MLKKYTTLSALSVILFTSIFVSNTIFASLHEFSGAQETQIQETNKTETQQIKTQEDSQQAPETPALTLDSAQPANPLPKTTGQRIVSGLAHTALAVPSACLATMLLLATNKTDILKEPFFFTSALITALHGSYEGTTGIYHAIKNSAEAAEYPVTKMDLAKNSILAIASGIMLHDACTRSDTDILALLFNIPAIYGFSKSFKTIYQAIQQRNAHSELQESEIQNITE